MERFDLQIGVPLRVRGEYVMHWEVAGLRIRPPWHRIPVLCRLETPEGRVVGGFELAGLPLPDNWRHHRGAKFDIVAVVTPLERGHWGHYGIQRWRLRLDELIEISMRSPRGRRGL